jgi:exonuclease III
MSRFVIATYNVNSIRSRLPIVLSWLQEHRPDALCLQETKVDDARLIRTDPASVSSVPDGSCCMETL